MTRARSRSSTASATRTPPAPTSAPWTSGTPASRTRWGRKAGAGRLARELDPHKENVLTAINFGHGLPRALAVPGVPVAAISDLGTYGLLTGISDQEQRSKALDLFSRMYSPTGRRQLCH